MGCVIALFLCPAMFRGAPQCFLHTEVILLCPAMFRGAPQCFLHTEVIFLCSAMFRGAPQCFLHTEVIFIMRKNEPSMGFEPTTDSLRMNCSTY